MALAAALLLAACDAAVDVEATANLPARYSHVLVTVKEVWFNESATAVPGDDTWEKFRLDESRTLDLTDVMGGELARLASDMVLPVGTYRQMRLLLVDRDASLRDSADDLGAEYNNEVTLYEDDGDERTYPLEVLSPDHGIGIQMKIEVEGAAEDSDTDSPYTLLLAFDAARDLTEFRYSGETGFLLNPAMKAYSADEAGTIQGALDLSGLDFETETGRPAIQVSAQRLDEALRRRVEVASTAVSAAGEFVLYPLPLDEDEDETEYDLVIHGPEIQTIVIRDVPVSAGSPSDAADLALGNLVPDPAGSYEANVDEASPVTPRGARVGFYQTLPDENDPYLIELAPLDPVRGRFGRAVALSRADEISYGTYGSGFSLRSNDPEEGASRYALAAVSPQYGHGTFADTVLGPPASSSDTASFAVPAIGIPADAVAGTLSTTVTVETAGKYDKGVLIVSHDGAVVTVVSLDDLLQQQVGTAFVEVPDVPAGTASSARAASGYYIEAWTWKASDPEDTFARHAGADLIDLRAVETAAASVTIQ